MTAQSHIITTDHTSVGKARKMLPLSQISLSVLFAILFVLALMLSGCGNAGNASVAKPLTGSLPARPSRSDAEIAKWDAKSRENPKDTRSLVNLGDALMQKARETSDIAYYNHAEDAYKKALAVDPRSAEAMTGLAWVASGRHDFEQSVEWANKSILLNPNDNAPYGLLGDAAVEMGNNDAAFKHYQKMLDVRPDVSSYSRGAHLLFLNGDSRKALWLMNKAVKTGAPYAENTAWCRAQIVSMLWSNGAILPAEQIVNDALKKTPDNYHLLLAAGKIRTARKDYKGAIAAYQKAIAIAPQHEALVLLGDLYHITGDEAKAKEQYDLVESVYQMNKKNGMRGDWAMAKFYADHDRNLPEALKLVQEEYKTRPNVAVADTLAWCLYKNGQYEQAKQYSQKALSQNTPDASYVYHAGMIAAKLGDRPTAQRLLYQCESMNPNFDPLAAPVAAETFKALGSVNSPGKSSKQVATGRKP